MSPPVLTPTERDELLEEIRTRRAYAEAQWQEIRDAGDADMRDVAGDPWDPKDRAAREAAGRPCLALDELGQYTNQVANDVRANPRGMKFSAAGDGATDEGARFYQDKAREIEYRSHAAEAYTTAFTNALNRSYGYVRLTTRHEPHSFDQELWIEAVVDPNQILPDPSAEPDLKKKYCFVFTQMPVDEFKREFPDATIHDFAPYRSLYPTWAQEHTITLAEYWRVTTTERELLLVQPAPLAAPNPFLPPVRVPPIVRYADEPGQPGDVVLNRRLELVPTVTQYLTNGVEILKVTPWAGQYIPIASCYGLILYVDDGSGTKKVIQSMVRKAHGPWMLYCYYRTAQAEQVGMSTKFPFMAYEGQLSEEQQSQIARSLHEPVAVIEAKAMTEATGMQLLPLPVRQTFEPAIQALEMGAEGARRSIQAAMGLSPSPTSAQRLNEKSGVALKQIESSGQRGTFHFVDHYNGMIRDVGVMVEDLIDKIYDTPRAVAIRKADESGVSVGINGAVSPDGQPSVSTKGRYLVTVSTGPSVDSERDAVSQFADTLATLPGVFPLIASDIVKMKNLGPMGDALAEKLEIMQPPELRAKSKDGPPPLPPEVQQAMTQLQQQLQQVTQAAAAMQKVIDTEQVKQQAVIAKAQVDAAAAQARAAADLQLAQFESSEAIKLQTMKDATAIRVAEIAAQVKGVLIAHEHEAAALAQQTDLAATAEQAERDRRHDVLMAQVNRRQETDSLEQPPVE